MKHVNLILACNIQAYRRRRYWSQAALARRIGVTPQAVSKWEQAKSAPDISLLPTLASVLGCHIDELFSCDQCDECDTCDKNREMERKAVFR